MNGPLTTDQALQKMRQYCGYSERCHSDVISKLYDLKVWKKDHDEIIATLIEENFLNEERFAQSFSGGHFRQKQWGRNKIKNELRLKKVSEFCIKKGLKEINEKDYAATLEKLFMQKWNSLTDKNRFTKMKKTSSYLLQKGYEPDMINSLFSKV